jgi:hypothetical protein
MKKIFFYFSVLLLTNIAQAKVVNSIGLFGNYGFTAFKNSKEFAKENALGMKINFKLSKKMELVFMPNFHVQEEFTLPVFYPSFGCELTATDTFFLVKNKSLSLGFQTKYYLIKEEKLNIYNHLGISFLYNYGYIKKYTFANKYLRTESGIYKEKSYNLKMLIGFGMQYNISRKINFEFEPTIYINSPEDSNFTKHGKQDAGIIFGVGLNYCFLK